jgi:hypothetical protein
MAPGADFGAFVAETGTGARSTFLFVNQDGTFEFTSYGEVDQTRLEAEINDLLAR